MKQSITTRFSIWVVLVSVAVLLGIVGINFLFIKKQLIHSANNKAEIEIIKSQDKINKILFKALKSSSEAKNSLQRRGLQQSNITSTLTIMLEKNRYIYGMSVAMEPGVVYKKPFSPYYYKNRGHIVYANLATSQYNYLAQPWYRDVKNSKTPKWSEPYFDEGGGETLMATYSNPIFENGKFAGVVTIDLSLQELSNIVSSIKILKTGYAFLLSKKHTVLVNPNSSMIMKRYKKGKIRFDKIIKKDNQWIYYTKIYSTDWVLGIVLPQDELFAPMYKITIISIILAIIGVIALIFTIYIVSKKITKPLKDVISRSIDISNGNFNEHIKIPKTKDEIYQLSQAINKMQDEIKKYITNLEDATKKEQKVKSELYIANKIQTDMLPIVSNVKIKNTLGVYASLASAREVGGDFYDFFDLGDDKFCFVIADVSGKGVPAALFMAVTISYIRAFSSKELSPAMVVEKVNSALCLNNEACMFVTMFFAVLDMKSFKLSYVNAGHPKPYIFSSSKTPLELDSKNDPIVGAMDGIGYTDFHIQLQRGERVFLYTDGVNEAFSKDGEQFGQKRIEESLQRLKQIDSRFILEEVSKCINTFSKGAEQSDDITMMLVEIS